MHKNIDKKKKNTASARQDRVSAGLSRAELREIVAEILGLGRRTMNVNHRELRSHDRDGRAEAPRRSDLRARYERTLILARGSEMIGDTFEAERFYQEADHYRRLLNNQAA